MNMNDVHDLSTTPSEQHMAVAITELSTGRTITLEFILRTHPLMQIPTNVRQTILPTPDTTIRQLLDFKLPETLRARGTYEIERMVTNMATTEFSMSILPQIPIPPVTDLQEIAKAAIIIAVNGGGVNLLCSLSLGRTEPIPSLDSIILDRSCHHC